MGKGAAGERDPLASQVPSSHLSTRELLARDIAFVPLREDNIGYVRLHRHLVPPTFTPQTQASDLWQVGAPYQDATGQAHMFGGLLLLGADRFANATKIDDTTGTWAFTFTDDIVAGFEQSDLATACTCGEFGSLRICPHQAFAILYAVSGLLDPQKPPRARTNYLERWVRTPTGEALAALLGSFYASVRAHTRSFLIDDAVLEARIRPE